MFYNEKMLQLKPHNSINYDIIKEALKNKTISCLHFIEVRNMILWDQAFKGKKFFEEDDQWELKERLWDENLSKLEFYGYNQLELHELFEFQQNEMIGLGIYLLQRLKEHLLIRYPDKNFFLRFYYWTDGKDVEAQVGFHTIRFDEPIGGNDLKDSPGAAVIYEFILH